LGDPSFILGLIVVALALVAFVRSFWNPPPRIKGGNEASMPGTGFRPLDAEDWQAESDDANPKR
jgi:hypothetical protein